MNQALGVALLWCISIGFAAGIFIRSVMLVPDIVPLVLILVATICLLVLGTTRHLRVGILVAFFCVACGVGIVRMNAAIVPQHNALEQYIGTRISILGVIADEPDMRATQVRVPIRVVSVGSSASSGTVLAVFPAHTELYYGEHVLVQGIVQLPQVFESGEGREFNYPGYLATRGISHMLERAQLVSGEGFQGSILTSFAYEIKAVFVRGLEQSLPEPHAGLAGGITVGDKRAMGKELTKEFRDVSLMHIVVLSGYNITIVISALFAALATAPRWLRFSLGGFVALFFALMTGFASASLRAALMAIIAASGTVSGRIYRPDRALIFVSTLMLAWNPYLLVFDPGFQLSFLACAGLLVFAPLCAGYAVFVPVRFGLREIFVSTVSAQTAVLPLLLYQSGTLSLVSVPANMLALVAIPPAMLFSAVAAVAGLGPGELAPIVGLPAYLLLSYVLAVAHVLSSFEYAALTLPAFSAWCLVPVYGALFGLGLYKNYSIYKNTSRE